jgi:tetratricopeptide (TPR) repeat protein
MPVTPSDVRNKIERIIEAFEEAWLGGAKPRIEDFVKNAGDVRRDLLIELAFTDLEYRLRGGETRVVEDIGARFPELKVDGDAWRGLIAEEYRLLRRLGKNPSKEEYHRRFPGHKSQIESALADEHLYATVLRTGTYTSVIKLPELGGRYRAQRIIAEGGMGYIARIVDAEFDRPLAMKVLARSLKGDEEHEERFLREARLTGQLQHPGIPPVQEKGRFDDGTPYFIMKLIKGHSLQKLLRDREAPTERLGHFLGVFLSVCQTMAYAHSRGIIHRDLKPANIMVGAFGEVQVMDWGLAKVLRADSAMPGAPATAAEYTDTVHIVQSKTSVGQKTELGAVMGTPSFMAPEQARGQTDQIDQRCDVFGLGGILCEILTGAPPFVNTNKVSAQAQAMMGDLSGAFARLDRSANDAELIALAKRCLAPEMADRLADAKAVADAVAAYQTQADERLKQAELEQARLVTKAQAEKARRRDRLLLGGCIAALLIAAIFAWQWHREKLADEAIRQSVSAAVRGVNQVDSAISLVDYGLGMFQQRNFDEAKKTLGQSKLVADDARKNLDKTKLAESDAKGVQEKFKEFDERFKAADRNIRFAQQLALAFEGRGTLKESDYDSRIRAVAVFGRAGPSIYEAAFAEFGAPHERGEPADVAGQLASFPLRDALGLALTDWMLFERAAPSVKRLFEIAEVVDPNPVRSRLRRGIYKGDANDLTAFSRKFEPSGQPAMFAILLADALYGVERYDDALRFLSRAREEIPGDFWINQMLGVFLRAVEPERNAEAVARFESAYVLRPKSPFVTTSLAQAFNDERRHNHAERVCRHFLKEVDKQEPHVRALLADTLVLQGELAQAENELRAGLKVHPNSGFLNATFASLHGYLGKYKEQEEIAQKTLATHSSFISAIVPLGYAQLNLNKLDDALETGEYLIAWNPKKAVGYDLVSRIFAERKKVDKAEDYAAKAVAREPKDPRAHQTMGHVLFAKRDHKRGFLSYQKAANLMNSPLPTFKGPARELAAQNLYPEATWLYAEIVKRDPTDKAAWDGLISVLKVTHEVAEAKERLGASYAKLTPEQTKEFEAITPAERRPVNATAIVTRPPNVQQPPLAPESPKRNQ